MKFLREVEDVGISGRVSSAFSDVSRAAMEDPSEITPIRATPSLASEKKKLNLEDLQHILRQEHRQKQVEKRTNTRMVAAARTCAAIPR